ncbi:neuronal acetylcholine receptor subunit alpha-2-like [Saccostrea cucullata]|uniref:neuronal acetylcholine receptor subunit alpha-2-like n=1 Tax=Saccostrea cuccullata TaxID=36930 RepID=UPI002ED60BD2
MFAIVELFIVIMTLWPLTSTSKAEPLNDFPQNYTKNNKQTVVDISFNVFHLIDIDDRNGKFTVNGYLEMSWIDLNITTNLEDSPKYFKESEIWTPEIRQINHNSRFDSEKMVDETVMCYRDGSALMVKMDVFTSECQTDFFEFPWDTQKCSIDIVAWGSFVGETIFKAAENKVNTKLYQQNKDWILIDTRISVDFMDFFTKHRTFQVSRAKIEFTISRHSSYYVCFLIFPLTLMQFLQILVFWMPWDCGERSSFSVTVLLAIAIYLTLVAEYIPKSSKTNYTYMGMKVIYDLLVAGFVQLSVIIVHRVYSNSCQLDMKIVRSCKTCEVFNDPEETSSDINREHNTVWIDRGKTLDKCFYRLTLALTIISLVFTFLVFIYSRIEILYM